MIYKKSWFQEKKNNFFSCQTEKKEASLIPLSLFLLIYILAIKDKMEVSFHVGYFRELWYVTGLYLFFIWGCLDATVS